VTTHQDPDILAQLEQLNLKTDNNTTAITQLAEIVRYQSIQAERDRQTFQNAIAQINQRAESDRQTFQNAIAEINQRAEIDRNTFIDQITEIFEEIEQLQEQAERDREAATADRQQAAIDRQSWQGEIRRIWEYLYLLQGKNGNSPQ
jgi:flagellar hook-associated protein FlgK